VPIGVERDDPGRLLVARAVEQQQLDTSGVLREDAEVDAVRMERGAQGGAGSYADD
jgi:hypothetical protein